MSFHIKGLNPSQFKTLFDKSDAELEHLNIRRYYVNTPNAFPDRIELRDLKVGETALLLNFEHLPVASPYRSNHAIFVGEQSSNQFDRENEIPEALTRRMIALRAFSEEDFIIHADLATGEEIAALVRTMFEDSAVKYIHAHFAKPGCFAARIDRIPPPHS